MKTETHPLDHVLGPTGLPSRLVLSERERQQLRTAAVLLAAIRECMADDERDTDIALAAYTCEDLAAEGFVQL